MMKNRLLAFLAVLAGLLLATAAALPARAAGGGIAWDTFPKERATDLSALQNGARLYMNYCSGCHSASFMRYNRLRDIGLSNEQIEQNLIFTGAKVGETMQIATTPRDAKEWFGGQPPDLTLIARSRSAVGQGTGADYLYTLLRNYYRDDTKVTGWNNLAYPNIGMPHPLWELQGQVGAVFAQARDSRDPNKKHDVFQRYESLAPGTLSAEEYRVAVADLVAFLQWMGEPNAQSRFRIGVGVLLFLLVFTFIAWRLNAAYWKDVK
jgi:ubiquinol-cytochrome c reductase cytochrome c1 subunit